MKRFAFAIGVIALGFAAATPARADFAVMKFETGFCRVYWDSSAKPVFGMGTVVAKAGTWEAAWAAQTAAVKKGKCK
jgi:hypothetical protein